MSVFDIVNSVPVRADNIGSSLSKADSNDYYRLKALREAGDSISLGPSSAITIGGTDVNIGGQPVEIE